MARPLLLLLALALAAPAHAAFVMTSPVPATSVWTACGACAPVLRDVPVPQLRRDFGDLKPLWFWTSESPPNCRNWTADHADLKGQMVVVVPATNSRTVAFADCDLAFPVLCACNGTVLDATASGVNEMVRATLVAVLIALVQLCVA